MIEKLTGPLRRQWMTAAIALGCAMLITPLVIRSMHTSYQGTAHVALLDQSASRQPLIPSTDMPQLVTSEIVLSRVRKRAQLSLSLPQLASRISARVAPRSEVMPITFRGATESEAITVANALADNLSQYYRELASHQYDELTTYLRDTLTEQRRSILSLEHRLQVAASRDAFVGSDKAVDNFAAHLDELETRRSTVYAALVADQAQAAALTRQPAEVSGVINQQLLASDPYYQNLLTAVASDKAKLDATHAAFTERYPGLRGMVEQVKRESPRLAAVKAHVLAGSKSASAVYAQSVLQAREASAAVDGDRAKLNALDEQLAQAKTQLAHLPGTHVAVAALRLERDAAQSAYAVLEARYRMTLADQAQSAALGSIVVVDHATSAAPRIPRSLMATLIATVIFCLAIGSAYFADGLARRSRRDLERIYESPLIGTVGEP